MNPTQGFSSLFVTDPNAAQRVFGVHPFNPGSYGLLPYGGNGSIDPLHLKREGAFKELLQRPMPPIADESTLNSYKSSGKLMPQPQQIQKPEKPYVCKTCNQSFTQVSNLKRHERLHTGEKPYACDRCSKAFTTVSNLKQHQQVHEKTEERSKFQCKICDKAYFYQSSLNKHMKTHRKGGGAGSNNEDDSESQRQGGDLYHGGSAEGCESTPSDISPTTKKVKKEKELEQQSGLNLSKTSSAVPSKPANFDQPNVNGVGGNVFGNIVANLNGSAGNLGNMNRNAEEEFKLNNFMKMLNQTQASLGFKSIPGLPSHLGLPGGPAGFSQGYNGMQSQQTNLINQVQDIRQLLNNTQNPLLVGKMEEARNSYLAERQQGDRAFPFPQYPGYDLYRPNIYNLLGQDLLSQKPKVIQEGYNQSNLTDNHGVSQPNIGNSTNTANNVSETNPLIGVTNEGANEFVHPNSKVDNKVSDITDMIDYELEKLRESRLRKTSLGSDYGGVRYY